MGREVIGVCTNVAACLQNTRDMDKQATMPISALSMLPGWCGHRAGPDSMGKAARLGIAAGVRSIGAIRLVQKIDEVLERRRRLASHRPKQKRLRQPHQPQRDDMSSMGIAPANRIRTSGYLRSVHSEPLAALRPSDDAKRPK